MTRVLIACLLVFAFYTPAALVAASSAEEQRVVVNLTHGTDDLHSVLMAVGLATGMAQEGASVTLFLNVEAVRLADANQPLNLTWGDSAPVGQLMAGFVEAGGEILLCGHCAKLAGVTKENLRPGARLAKPGEPARLILAADKVLDY